MRLVGRVERVNRPLTPNLGWRTVWQFNKLGKIWIKKKCRIESAVLRTEGPSTIRACPGGLITEWLQGHPNFQILHVGRSIAFSDGAAEMGRKDNGFLGNGSYSVIAPTGASPVGAILVAAPPA